MLTEFDKTNTIVIPCLNGVGGNVYAERLEAYASGAFHGLLTHAGSCEISCGISGSACIGAVLRTFRGTLRAHRERKEKLHR